MDSSRIEDFVANAALLAAHLTQQCEQAAAQQQAAAEGLQRSGDAVRSAVAAGKAELADHARQAVREGLSKEVGALTRSLDESGERLRRAAAELQREQDQIGRRMQALSWRSIISIGAAMLVVVAGTAFWAWQNVQRAERAQVRAEVLEALQQVAITSCDGRPCLKLEAGLPRWDRNEEYVLIDTSVAPPPGPPADGAP
ncbi:hypothetical protein LDO32_07370 [Luteimonas sp. Y-2-2-4F]|nr:hypothetical protein [Luteimonas sp. Y-2-2-4F]MCD9031546.1 hypothetical protein [Luteimonas sp. Y-2-2-4F]